MKPAGEEGPGSIPPADRLQVAHGCTLLAWGLGAVFLLLTGAVRIPALDRLLVPAYVPALGLVAWGLRTLRDGPLGRTGACVTWRTLAPLGLLLYLAPFYAWWERVPHPAFFVAHVIGIAAAGIWLLFEVNRSGAKIALRLGQTALASEAGIFGLIVLAAGMAIPAFAAVAVLRSWSRGTSLYAACFELLYHLPRTWIVPALAPLSLTMASCWRLRRSALDSLRPATDSVREELPPVR